jgi:hypothetical protein
MAGVDVDVAGGVMMPRPRLASRAIAISLISLLAACAQMQRASNRGMESELSLAGFKVLIADTAEKQTMLHTLSPRTVTRMDRPDGTYFFYADPDLCSCLYVGRQAEYDAYQKLLVERQLSDQQMYANEMAQDRQVGWGPTGPWGYSGYGGGGGYGGFGGYGGYGGGYGAGYGYGGYNMRPAWDPW